MCPHRYLPGAVGCRKSDKPMAMLIWEFCARLVDLLQDAPCLAGLGERAVLIKQCQPVIAAFLGCGDVGSPGWVRGRPRQEPDLAAQPCGTLPAAAWPHLGTEMS